MSYHLPSSNGAPPFAPTTFPYNSTRSFGPFHQRQSSNALLEQEYPTGRPEGVSQPFPTSNSSTRHAQHQYGYWQLGNTRVNNDLIPRVHGPGTSMGRRILLSTPSIQDEFIRITLPRRHHGYRDCPFRLVDCQYFLQTGHLAVWQFNEPFLRAEVEIPDFEIIQKSVAQDYNWVAVSYDDSDTRMGRVSRQHSEDALESPVTQCSPIRDDVLRSLCNIAIKQFGVSYLWLDKLCVFQNSTTEVARWCMPGNVKWAFGLAKGTIVLLNGLHKALPTRLPGDGACYYPILAHTSDFAISLRVFLELAFNNDLQSVVVPFVYHQSDHEQGNPSAEVGWRTTMPPGAQLVHTVQLKGFLEKSARAAQSLRTGNGPVGRALELYQRMAQLQLGHNPTVTALGPDNTWTQRYLVRVNNLLSLLSSRDRLLREPSSFAQYSRKWDQEISTLEIAIWRSVLLDRDAKSYTQLVFGLSFLLQDLCNVLRGDLSEVDLVSYVWDTVRQGLDDDTGEVNLKTTFVYNGLASVVGRFNQISRPTAELVKILKKEHSWNVPLSPEWIPSHECFEDVQDTTLREYQDPKLKGAIARLQLTTARHKDGNHDILVLELVGMHDGILGAVTRVNNERIYERTNKTVLIGDVWFVPARVFYDGGNRFLVVYLELEVRQRFGRTLEYWLVSRFYLHQDENWDVASERIVSFPLTPDWKTLTSE